MRESQKKQIDDSEYEFFALPPADALKVLTRLSKLVLEPMGMLGDALSGGNGADKKKDDSIVGLLDRKLPPDTFAKAIRAFVGRLDEDEVLATVKIVLAKCYVQGPDDKGTRPIKLDSDFSGRVGHLLKVVAGALEYNFSDFFPASGGGLGGLLDKMKSLT